MTESAHLLQWLGVVHFYLGDPMAIATQKRETESNEKLISRWKKKTQQAAIVQQVRSKRYFEKNVNRRKEKDRALVREKFRGERQLNQFYS